MRNFRFAVFLLVLNFVLSAFVQGQDNSLWSDSLLLAQLSKIEPESCEQFSLQNPIFDSQAYKGSGHIRSFEIINWDNLIVGFGQVSRSAQGSILYAYVVDSMFTCLNQNGEVYFSGLSYTSSLSSVSYSGASDFTLNFSYLPMLWVKSIYVWKDPISMSDIDYGVLKDGNGEIQILSQFLESPMKTVYRYANGYALGYAYEYYKLNDADTWRLCSINWVKHKKFYGIRVEIYKDGSASASFKCHSEDGVFYMTGYYYHISAKGKVKYVYYYDNKSEGEVDKRKRRELKKVIIDVHDIDDLAMKLYPGFSHSSSSWDCDDVNMREW